MLLIENKPITNGFVCKFIKLKIMRNLHIFTIAGLCLLLSSCATVTYFGDTVTPATTNVDVFYSAHDVTKQYKVIGHLNYPYSGSQDVVKAKELYDFRLPMYEHYANIILETDNKTAEEVSEIILGDL